MISQHNTDTRADSDAIDAVRDSQQMPERTLSSSTTISRGYSRHSLFVLAIKLLIAGFMLIAPIFDQFYGFSKNSLRA
jgi:hypothetical protein